MSETLKPSRGRQLAAENWKRLAEWLLAEDVDEGVNRVLALMGELHRADRAWVIRYDDDFTVLWITHEWVRPGIEPQLMKLQGVPVEVGLWIHERLHRDGFCMIPEVDALPRRARMLQAELQRQSVRSLLGLPVFREGKLAFMIGYDAVRAPMVWEESEIRDLADVAELISRALTIRGGGGVWADPGSLDPASRTLHLRNGAGSVAVPMAEIVWVEADGDYTIVHTTTRQRFTERRSVKDWEGLLARQDFLRIHRSAIVRVSAIRRLDRSGGKWRVTLATGGPELPVGRAYHRVLRLRLGL